MSAVRLLDGAISDINTTLEKSKKISSQLLTIFILKFLWLILWYPQTALLFLKVNGHIIWNGKGKACII